MSDDPLAVVRALAVHLAAVGAEWAAGGSVASSVHGVPRSTADVDLVVDLPPGTGARLERAPDFFVDGESLERELASGRWYNVFHAGSATKVDLFPAVGAFERAQLARAVVIAGVRVTSAEDTVLAKLRWFRKGGETSERQWRDVLGIVAVQRGRLDLPYLTGWARRLGVEDLLTRALADETGGF